MVGHSNIWRSGVDESNIWNIASIESPERCPTTGCRSWPDSRVVPLATATSSATGLAIDWSDSCDAMGAVPTDCASLLRDWISGTAT